MKLFLDTNLFLRIIVKEDLKKHAQVTKILTQIENGLIRPYSSTIVLLEIFHTLTKFYKVPKQEAVNFIKEILDIKNLTLIEKTNFKKALLLLEKYNVKFTDILIAQQVPQGCKICTFDKEIKKLDFIDYCDPSEI
ncbi:PIN domain-containing protein [candidate division WWE3 bacterium]|nr:PIN domain-containing protein [candidate division WWE3 bacterium]